MHFPQSMQPDCQNSIYDNVYEVPIDNVPIALPSQSTYEIPNGSIQSISGSAFEHEETGWPSVVAELVKKNATSMPRTTRPSLPSSTNKVADTFSANPPLPLPPNPRGPVKNGDQDYYDHGPFDRAVVTVWWRGRVRVTINFYLAVAILVIVALLAIASTTTVIFLLFIQEGCHPTPLVTTLAPTTRTSPEWSSWPPYTHGQDIDTVGL